MILKNETFIFHPFGNKGEWKTDFMRQKGKILATRYLIQN